MTYKDFHDGRFYNADCFDVFPEIPDGVVDMVLADLPYGTTQCTWDAVLPFDALWSAYRRIAKPNAAIVLTASQPFTSALVMSNAREFRHAWVWDKAQTGNPLNAKRQPLKITEDVLVFGASPVRYFPQMRTGKLRKKGGEKTRDDSIHGATAGKVTYSDQYYPTNIIRFANCGSKRDRIHPTQKPVALFEYLIRTYTQPGELVLDNTAGSGTTAVAARNTERRWVCIEKDPEYYAKALGRLE